MRLGRRRFLKIAGGTFAAPALARTAMAQAYPSRPVRIMISVAPGGAADFSARLAGQWLSERLGQPVVIENRPGGGGNIATAAVLSSPPDGYTLLLAVVSNAVNATLYSKLSFDFLADSAPVAGVARVPNLMVASTKVPASTVAEFIAYAKANPGKLNYGSAGIGTASHMAGELFKSATGTEIVHVPYRGNALVLTALLAGDIQLGFPDMASSIEHVKAGTLRALGVTTLARSPAVPDVPAVAETLPDYDASSWFGLVAPKGTPKDIVDRLNKELNAALATPEAKARVAEIGGTVIEGSAESFGDFLTRETRRWGEVVKVSGAKAE
jgi:tripartite-type tricarboxylate transporter receptor subunit TctC